MAFSIYELQDGKKINQRDYSLLVEANDRGANTLKIGTKVPIDTGKDPTPILTWALSCGVRRQRL